MEAEQTIMMSNTGFCNLFIRKKKLSKTPAVITVGKLRVVIRAEKLFTLLTEASGA